MDTFHQAGRVAELGSFSVATRFYMRTMSSNALVARKLLRIFCPRALIVAALIAHIILALMFWVLCLAHLVGIARLYPVIGPVIGFTCVLLFVTLAVWLTRTAWRRSTWFVAILFLIASVITLPWTVITILGWFNPI
ncbi:MAG: hypothetical protein JW395_4065 [Nitrospira sp.]|nr:hypothetical protein [Nitrospira sp.]